MKCWKCQGQLPEPEVGKITFRAECEKCEASLHCCYNCKYYYPGKPNDCEVPGTDFIADRTKMNFCEEFKLKRPAEMVFNKLQDVDNKLFGDTPIRCDQPQNPKDKFNSLFKE